MPKVEYGSFTIVSNGTNTIFLNDDTINIQSIVLFIADSSNEVSAGVFDGTNTYTGSSAYSDENYTKTLTHYRNISGVKTKIIETVVTNISDVGEFSTNTTTLTSSKQIRFVVFGS